MFTLLMNILRHIRWRRARASKSHNTRANIELHDVPLPASGPGEHPRTSSPSQVTAASSPPHILHDTPAYVAAVGEAHGNCALDNQGQQKVQDQQRDDADLCRMLEAMDVPNSPTKVHSLRLDMIKYCLHYEVLPSSLFVKAAVDVNPEVFRTSGAYGDVVYALFEKQPVAMKRLRVTPSNDPRKDLYREALLWRTLKHSSVLPFLGLCYTADDGHTVPWMISPWMENGDLTNYLQRHPGMVDVQSKKAWILELASGLVYLHGNRVVHGDLHGGNIFLDQEMHIKIADFGLATLVDAGQDTMKLSVWRLGALQWMAPELFEPGARCTLEADVYSFACLCLQIVTEQYPWGNIRSHQVLTAILRKQALQWPENTGTELSQLRHLMEQCWSRAPATRPTMQEGQSQLETLFNVPS